MVKYYLCPWCKTHFSKEEKYNPPIQCPICQGDAGIKNQIHRDEWNRVIHFTDLPVHGLWPEYIEARNKRVMGIQE